MNKRIKFAKHFTTIATALTEDETVPMKQPQKMENLPNRIIFQPSHCSLLAPRLCQRLAQTPNSKISSGCREMAAAGKLQLL
jgi:hypothetical protein